LPKSIALIAAAYPAGPPPITIKSKSVFFIEIFL
jgi:hypothetical protein